MSASLNPFSKKRKFDEVSSSSAAVKGGDLNKSSNTVYYDAQSNAPAEVSYDDYQSAQPGDESRMEIDTASAPVQKVEEVKKPQEP